MTTQQSSSVSSSSKAAAKARETAPLIALRASGRLMVRISMWPLRSRSSSDMAVSPGASACRQTVARRRPAARPRDRRPVRARRASPTAATVSSSAAADRHLAAVGEAPRSSVPRSAPRRASRTTVAATDAWRRSPPRHRGRPRPRSRRSPPAPARCRPDGSPPVAASCRRGRARAWSRTTRARWPARACRARSVPRRDADGR